MLPSSSSVQLFRDQKKKRKEKTFSVFKIRNLAQEMDFVGDGRSGEGYPESMRLSKCWQNQSSHHVQAERRWSQRYDGNPWLWVTTWRLKLVGFLAGTGNLKVKVASAKAEKGAPWLFPSSCLWSWSLGSPGQASSGIFLNTSRTEDKGKHDHSRHKGHAVQVVSKSRDGFAPNSPCCFSYESLKLTVLIPWDSKREACSQNVRVLRSLNQWRLSHWSNIASCQTDKLHIKWFIFHSLSLQKIYIATSPCSLPRATGNIFGLW